MVMNDFSEEKLLHSDEHGLAKTKINNDGKYSFFP